MPPLRWPRDAAVPAPALVRNATRGRHERRPYGTTRCGDDGTVIPRRLWSFPAPPASTRPAPMHPRIHARRRAVTPAPSLPFSVPTWPRTGGGPVIAPVVAVPGARGNREGSGAQCRSPHPHRGGIHAARCSRFAPMSGRTAAGSVADAGHARDEPIDFIGGRVTRAPGADEAARRHAERVQHRVRVEVAARQEERTLREMPRHV